MLKNAVHWLSNSEKIISMYKAFYRATENAYARSFCRLNVCPSVCLSVCLSVNHLGMSQDEKLYCQNSYTM